MKFWRAITEWFNDEKSETFLSEDEIVADMVLNARKSEENVRSWLNVTRADLITGHHTTGCFIRNHYKLWYEGNPHTVNGYSVNAQGIADHPNHPDQMSMRIMERVWDNLHGVAS
jgi:hypothetical protein